MNVRVFTSIVDLFYIAYGCFALSGIISYFMGFTLTTMLVLTVVIAVVSSWLILQRWECDTKFEPESKQDVVVLCSFILIAVLFTLCMHRPDADDEAYLGMAVLVLDFVHLPLQEIPTGGYKKYFLSSFHTLQAGITYLTGIPLLISYYFIVPSIVAVCSVLIHWRVLRHLVQHRWIMGMIFFFIVMLVWGDVHRTHANFGFVRAFQGKAGFVMVIVPGILFYFLKFQHSSEKKHAALLFFTVVAGVGFTPTGIIVGPLLLGLLILANLTISREKRKQNIILALGLIIPIGLALIMRFYFGIDRSAVHTPRGIQAYTTNTEMLRYVIGDGFRGFFALLCLVLSPFCVTNPKVQKTYRGFVFIVVVMLLFPYTSAIIGKNTYATASWRWLWIIPFPLVMGIVMSRCFYFDYALKKVSTGVVFYTICTLIFVFSSERYVFSKKNGASIGVPAFKLHYKEKIKLRPYKEYGIIRGNYIYIEKPEKKIIYISENQGGASAILPLVVYRKNQRRF